MISIIIALVVLYIAVVIGLVIWGILIETFGTFGWFLGLGVFILLIVLAL